MIYLNFSAWPILMLWLTNSYVAYLHGRDEIYPYLKWSDNKENGSAFKFSLFLIVVATLLHFVLCFTEYVVRKIINYLCPATKPGTSKSQEHEELL